MKGIKKGLLAGMVLCCMPMLTACSFKETLGILWNSEDKKDAESDAEVKAKLEGANIDETVQVPTITNTLGDPVTYGLNGEAQPLVVEASVTDGGTLTYQWYRNNVDSNGGGTEIEGAVQNSFVPLTSEPGTVYYYVVVTNTLNKGIQMVTSITKCVTVTEEPAVAPEAPAETPVPGVAGNWVQNENGKMFMYPDGTYAVSKWELIQNGLYAFDERGCVRTGWYQDGEKWYYLNQDGLMVCNTVVDGYQLGPDGVRQ